MKKGKIFAYESAPIEAQNTKQMGISKYGIISMFTWFSNTIWFILPAVFFSPVKHDTIGKTGSILGIIFAICGYSRNGYPRWLLHCGMAMNCILLVMYFLLTSM